ncbi:hypothetical protein KBA27_00990 [bacterium]|nr:hypothetical protein [bacterium]
MRVNSINSINNSYRNNKVSFKGDETNTDNTAVLTLEGKNSLINFEKDAQFTRNADAVQSNPIKALAYKIYKAFKTFFGPNQNTNPEIETALCTYA